MATKRCGSSHTVPSTEIESKNNILFNKLIKHLMFKRSKINALQSLTEVMIVTQMYSILLNNHKQLCELYAKSRLVKSTEISYFYSIADHVTHLSPIRRKYPPAEERCGALCKSTTSVMEQE